MKFPILFLVFNRPEKTKKIVNFLNEYNNLTIYVSQDGPKNDKDKKLCEDVKNVINGLSSNHNIIRRYCETNLGCGNHVSSAIDWFFERVEEGVILEDDIIPSTVFLRECEVLLDRYKNISYVGAISGSPFFSQKLLKDTYFLSKYPNIWGWATWSDRWKGFKLTRPNKLNRLQVYRILRDNFPSFFISLYWLLILELCWTRKIDTWDFQFYWHLWKDKKLALVRRHHSTMNIGFDSEATHTRRINPGLEIVDLNKTKIYSSDLGEIIYDYDSRVDFGIFQRIYKPKILSLLGLIHRLIKIYHK